MKNRIAFAVLMGAITTGVVSFALIYFNLGFGDLFMKVWTGSWVLSYIIVIPIILAIAPKLQALIAQLFTSTSRARAGDTGALPQKIAFALVMGAVTTGIISLAVVLRNLGYTDDFAQRWLRSWAIGYAVVVPVLLIVSPRVGRLVDRALGQKTP